MRDEKPKRRDGVQFVCDLPSDVVVSHDALLALGRQFHLTQKPIPTPHALHIVGEYGMKPDFPPFP